MKVRYGKRDITIDPFLISDNESISGIKRRLEIFLQEGDEKSGEETEAFFDIKLILNGRILHDQELLSSVPGGKHAKIVMVAAKLSNLQAIEDKRVSVRVKDDLNISRQKSSQGKSKVTTFGTRSTLTQYGFQDIQVLPGLPRIDEARNILSSLANDPGVQAVMTKYKWSVGCLCEMYPEGYVGVSDVCVMGLNENKGQRILLRLRTDDLKGFRKILSIRKVLFHELSHNEFSEHGNDFYILMRQLERDVEQLDWTKSAGRRLVTDSTVFSPTIGNESSQSEEKSVFVLGGGELQSNLSTLSTLLDNNSMQQMPSARVLAGVAAVMRISDEEKELEQGCGVQTAVTTIVEEADEIGTDIDLSGEKEHIPSEVVLSNLVCEESKSIIPTEIFEFSVPTNNTTTSHTEQHMADTVKEEMEVEKEEEYLTRRETSLAAVDSAIMVSLSGESSAAVDRLLRLREALSELLLQDNFSLAVSSLSTIVKILHNAMSQSDAKYRNIKSSSQTFQRFISPLPAALTILQIAGFHWVSDNISSDQRQQYNDYNDSNSNNSMVRLLSLSQKADLGLLYMLHSILQQCLLCLTFS